MNQAIDIMSSYGYFVGITTFFVYILKSAIDFWFVTELEKKLMTDFQKLKGFVSKLIVTIIPSIFLASFLIATFDKDFLSSKEDIDRSFLFIVFLLIIFLLSISMSLIMTGIEKALNLKSIYTLVINSEEWNIERLTQNDLLLLTNMEDGYLLIDDWKNRKIKKVVNKNSYTYKIYSKSRVWKTLIGVSIFILLLIISIFFIFYDTNYSNLLLIAASFAFLTILLLVANLIEYRREYT